MASKQLKINSKKSKNYQKIFKYLNLDSFYELNSQNSKIVFFSSNKNY